MKSVSQEHVILAAQGDCCFMPYGTMVKILLQHACITASAHVWCFIIKDNFVVDVWVPAELW